MALKNPRRHLRQNRPKSYFAVNGKIDTTLSYHEFRFISYRTPSDGHDKPFCTKAITIIDNFKKALGDTDNTVQHKKKLKEKVS